jgi:hypothetical protein
VCNKLRRPPRGSSRVHRRPHLPERRRLGGGVFLIALGHAFLLSNFIGRGSVAALVLIALGLAILVNRYW